MRLFALLICAALFIGGAAQAQTIKVSTWNIEHLRAENNEGSVKRDDKDYEALSRTADELDAGIFALQEVDGPDAAARVFDPADYDFFFSDRNKV